MFFTYLTLSLKGLKPAIVISPLSGFNIPQSIFMVVDLPAPLGPMYPTISPFFISKEISSTACTSLYFLLISVLNASFSPEFLS